MNTKKISEIFKTAAEYFSTSAGAASLIIGLVAFAVFVPPFISIPIIGGFGLACAAVGAYRKWVRIDAELAAEQQHELEKVEVLSISRTLDKRVAEIVAAERKIEAKLDIPADDEEHKHDDRKSEPAHTHEEPKHAAVTAVAVNEDEHDDSYTETVVLPMARSTTPAHHLPKVTIRISNLPTFFTVDHHGGAHHHDHSHATPPQHDEKPARRRTACSS